MIELVKVNKKFEPNLNIGEYDSCYKLVKDNQGIGYGTINKNKENELFIFVDREQRGKGYGKILFSKMLDKTKEMGYKEVKIAFEKENTPMVKIANENKATPIPTDEDKIKYIIKIK